MSLEAVCFFFFNDTATTEIYTLSLHDALPISSRRGTGPPPFAGNGPRGPAARPPGHRLRRCRPCRASALHAAIQDRKSTRLNSSHANISYAVFCLKKKKTTDLDCIDINQLKTT